MIISQRKEKIYFPAADGRIKLSGGDQELRTSTLIRERPNRGESHVNFLGDSEGSLPPPQETSHTAITLNQESNFTRREKNHSQLH